MLVDSKTRCLSTAHFPPLYLLLLFEVVHQAYAARVAISPDLTVECHGTAMTFEEQNRHGTWLRGTILVCEWSRRNYRKEGRNYQVAKEDGLAVFAWKDGFIRWQGEIGHR